MELLKFIEDPSRHEQLAERVGTSKGWLWQIATGWRGKRASVEMAQAIARETEQIGPERVPLARLRPDIWPGSGLQVANDDACKEQGGNGARASHDVPVVQGQQTQGGVVHGAHSLAFAGESGGRRRPGGSP